ncbi:hypothetical protein [Stetteria hydrogenophila]
MHKDSGDVAVALLAEELAEYYRRMARNHKALHHHAMLSVAAEILEILAQEALTGRVAKSTIERSEIIVRYLRRNGLPHHRLESLVKLVRKLYTSYGELCEYGVPQVDVSNTILS